MKRLLLVLLICMLVSVSVFGQGLMGLWTDEVQNGWCIYGTGLYNIYCFALLPDEGLDSVELRMAISSPAIYLMAPEYNSDFILTLGDPISGFVGTFRSCKIDWVMVFSGMLYVPNTDIAFATLVPYPGSDYLKMLDCSGVESEAFLWVRVGINDPFCEYPSYDPPFLSSVEVEDETHIYAMFDKWVFEDSAEQADKYILFPKESPTDTIPVSSAEKVADTDVLLTLEESLVQQVTYTLRAVNVVGEFRSTITEVDFIFAPVAVLLQGFEAENVMGGVELSWRLAEASGDVSFTVSRRSALTGISEELDLQIERDGESYSCIDADIEPGESYVYRVDYVIDGETSLLFETDAVQTPALPLTLDQNVPNPFNPTTEISYYLPAAADVLLEVYDVTGKRIATLVRGREEKGPRTVNWHGTDDFGRGVASGIYFYRLSAGKETISKKMVLLR